MYCLQELHKARFVFFHNFSWITSSKVNPSGKVWWLQHLQRCSRRNQPRSTKPKAMTSTPAKQSSEISLSANFRVNRVTKCKVFTWNILKPEHGADQVTSTSKLIQWRLHTIPLWVLACPCSNLIIFFLPFFTSLSNVPTVAECCRYLQHSPTTIGSLSCSCYFIASYSFAEAVAFPGDFRDLPGLIAVFGKDPAGPGPGWPRRSAVCLSSSWHVWRLSDWHVVLTGSKGVISMSGYVWNWWIYNDIFIYIYCIISCIYIYIYIYIIYHAYIYIICHVYIYI